MARNVLRNRFFDDVRGEITRVALVQLAEGGPAAVSVNAIGKELGVSGPAIYRYFDSRDALLTALIIEAYDDLAAAMIAAVRGRRSPRTRLVAVAAAYRRWALYQPHRYRLLFRAPLPGYDPNSPELIRASEAALRVLVHAAEGHPGVEGAMVPDVRDYLRRRGLPTEDTATVRLALTTWARLHGLVELEIEQVFASMGIDPGPLYTDVTAGSS